MNSEPIMVSIYCLAYNHEPYIRDCLEGFVNQRTNFKYEVLIHDDASTDKTADIIREYEAEYPEIIKPIYQTENQYSQGVPIGKTFFSRRVKGKYVAFCEGDDYWCDANKLQKQFDFMQAHPDYTACVHNSKKLNCIDGTQELTCQETEDADIAVPDMVEQKNYHYQTSSLFMKKEFFLLPDEFRAKGFSDFQCGIYLAANGRVRYLSEVMSVYRFMSLGSWSERHKKEDRAKRLGHFEDMIRILHVFDTYTNGTYHDAFQKKLDINETYRLYYRGDFRGIIHNKTYRNIFFNRNGTKLNAAVVLGCVFPQFIQKLLF